MIYLQLRRYVEGKEKKQGKQHFVRAKVCPQCKRVPFFEGCLPARKMQKCTGLISHPLARTIYIMSLYNQNYLFSLLCYISEKKYVTLP